MKKRRPKSAPQRLLPFRTAHDQARPVAGAYNLGPKSAAWLDAIGIKSLDDVRTLGPIEVCRRLRAAGFAVSVVMAYALEGALAGCHWNRLSGETKAFLAREFAGLKHTRAAQKKNAAS